MTEPQNSELTINGKTYKTCQLIMIEIYGGKDPEWKGWHNLILDLGGPEFDKSIAGPIDPETSEQLKASIKATSGAAFNNHQ